MMNSGFLRAENSKSFQVTESAEDLMEMVRENQSAGDKE